MLSIGGLTLSFICKTLLLTGLLLALSWLSSCSAERLFRLTLAPAERPAVGFVMLMACGEIVGWPMVAFRLSSALFMALVGAAAAALALFGFLSWLRRPALPSVREDAPAARRIALLLALAAVALELVMTLVTFRSDSDDSFYVSNVALFANSSVLNPFDSSMGSHVVGTVPMYDFQIWESVLAMLCWVFRLGAAELCHTAMLPPLLLLAASAAFSLGLSLLGNERRAYLFTFVLSVFYIFSGANGYSVGAFLLGRVWQGKSASLTIVLPVLSALLLRELGRGERVQKRLWALLLACMLAAISFNPTGLYVVGFEMLFLTAAVAITEKRGRLMVHLLPPLAAGALFTFLIWLRTSQFPGQVDAASQAGRGFVLEQLQLVFAHQEVYLALFAVLFVAVLLRGGREARTYFVLTSVLLALFVWSPVLGRLVAQYATKTPSYWRVFWLIPVGPICAYSTVWLTEKLPRRWMHLAGVLVCSALLALPGEWMFTSAPADETPFLPSENVEKVPQETLDFGELLTDGGVRSPVLACEPLSTTLRQVWPKLELLVSRPQYILDLYVYRGQAETGEDLLRLRDFVNQGEPETDGIPALLAKYGVEYVILYRQCGIPQDCLLRAGWHIAAGTDNYVLMTCADELSPTQQG